MSDINYGDLPGVVATDAEHAVTMLRLLFPDPDEWVTLWLKSADRERESFSLFATAGFLIQAIENDGPKALDMPVYAPVWHGGERGRQQVYTGPGVLLEPRGEEHPRGIYINGRAHRARKDHIKHTWVVWIDLDVKAGSFGDRDAIWKLVWNVLDLGGVRPQLVVETGSGGLHLYWRLSEPIGPEESEELNQRIVYWAREQSGVGVDTCYAANHVMRLAGTVRWPKRGERTKGIEAKPVTLTRADKGWTSPDALRRLTESSWRRETQRRIEVDEAVIEQDRETARLLGAQDWSDVVLGEGLSGMALTHTAREAFNSEIPWVDILEPIGWTRIGSAKADGEQEWTRPWSGEGTAPNSRSATTDWSGAPNSMSLLSQSPATGLSHLHGTRVRLDKARVAAELWHDGDLAALLTEFLNDKRKALS